MTGVLGLTYRYFDLYDELRTQIADQVSRYKSIRDIIQESSAALLSQQAPTSPDGWDILQEATDDARHVILFAFKGNADDGRVVVHPTALLPNLSYRIDSLDQGTLGTAAGTDLMQDGVEIWHAGGTRAHVLVLTADE